MAGGFPQLIQEMMCGQIQGRVLIYRHQMMSNGRSLCALHSLYRQDHKVCHAKCVFRGTREYLLGREKIGSFV